MLKRQVLIRERKGIWNWSNYFKYNFKKKLLEFDIWNVKV